MGDAGSARAWSVGSESESESEEEEEEEEEEEGGRRGGEMFKLDATFSAVCGAVVPATKTSASFCLVLSTCLMSSIACNFCNPAVDLAFTDTNFIPTSSCG